MRAGELIFLLSAMCLLQVTFANFDYSSSSGKGPNKWATLFPNYCNKSSQSPVDIVTKNATYDCTLKEITLNAYTTIPSGPTMQIGNNGHSYRIIVKPNTFSISGGGLPGTYHLHSFHLHWGSDDTQGSEHTVDGKKYPAELHLVHFNNKYANLSNALNYADGLAVLGILLEVGNENTALQSFLKYAPNVTEPKELYNLNQTHALNQLLPVNTNHFYRYKGSLTTPYCQEIVTWTVFKNAAKISNDQLKLLRALKENNSTAMVNNYRPVQPLNGRVIKTTYKPPVVVPPGGGAHHMTNTMATILAVVIAALFKFF